MSTTCEATVTAFLCQRIAHYTGEKLADLTPAIDPLDFGLSSRDCAQICGEIQDAFGVSFNPARFFECPSIREIALAVLAAKEERCEAR